MKCYTFEHGTLKPFIVFCGNTETNEDYSTIHINSGSCINIPRLEWPKILYTFDTHKLWTPTVHPNKPEVILSNEVKKGWVKECDYHSIVNGQTKWIEVDEVNKKWINLMKKVVLKEPTPDTKEECLLFLKLPSRVRVEIDPDTGDGINTLFLAAPKLRKRIFLKGEGFENDYIDLDQHWYLYRMGKGSKLCYYQKATPRIVMISSSPERYKDLSKVDVNWLRRWEQGTIHWDGENLNITEKNRIVGKLFDLGDFKKKKFSAEAMKPKRRYIYATM